ncbi:MAG: TaqI-like C-terminal specificity domain-containing protein, partial [Halanaerobacter sp.]
YMRKELLTSTFAQAFSLERLQKLVAEIYNEEIKLKELNTQSKDVISFAALEPVRVPILVVRVAGELEWDFKLRKLVSDYLTEKGLQEGLAALSTPGQQEWLWTVVKREELSPYLLNSYSIPVGDSGAEIRLRSIEESLCGADLKELTTDFSSKLRDEFLAHCQEEYQRWQEELILESDLLAASDLNRAGIVQQLMIKIIVLYLLEKKGLLVVEFEEKIESLAAEKLIEVGRREILDIFLAGEEKIVLPKLKVLTDFWTSLADYKLSLREDAPWAKVLAVGPAILADLNEGLLNAKQRKRTGVFYTPQLVVHYMSQETLLNFLTTEVAKLSYEQAQSLVQEREIEGLDRSLLPQIYKSLEQVKFCDPAIGSGAFVLGMAKELLRIKEIVLYLIQDQVRKEELRLNIVRDSLHGVDIDTQALEITKLRLWLWTAVDEALPLADLELQILEANPLLKIERSLEQRDPDLRSARRNYYKRSDLEERKRYKEKFLELKADKLGTIFSFVDYFPTIFAAGGFDILIANPPYVGEKGNKELFRKIKKYALGEFYQGKMDLFYFFFHLGLDIVRDKGEIALITTNYYLTATGAYKLREDLQERGLIQKLINFNDLRLFPAALGQHNLITILQKSQEEEELKAETVITYREGDIKEQTLEQILVGVDVKSSYYEIPQKELYQGSKKYLHLEKGRVDELLAVLKEEGEGLGKLCNINQGLVSGCDRVSKRHVENYDLPPEVKGAGVFVVTAEEAKDLELSAEDEDLLKPWFKNSDIEQYSAKEEAEDEYILYLKESNLELPRAIKKHLQPFKEILKERREVAANRRRWWELQWPRREEIFEGPKLVLPQRSKINTFAYNEVPWYASADVYFITQKQSKVKLKYILALLNSNLYYLWLYYKGKKKGNLLELYQQPLTEVPIKIIKHAQQDIFVDLVDKIERRKEDLAQYQEFDFAEFRREELTTASRLGTIVKESKYFKINYQGQAKIVRQLKVESAGEKLRVYSAKANDEYYNLFEFVVSSDNLREYLQLYLESITVQELATINQRSNLFLIDRVLSISIRGYQEQEKVKRIVQDWQVIKQNEAKAAKRIEELKAEIDQLVYQLYNFTEEEIIILTKKAKEFKSS